MKNLFGGELFLIAVGIIIIIIGLFIFVFLFVNRNKKSSESSSRVNLFPKFNPHKIYTEEESRKAANRALFLAIGGWILSGWVIGIIAEAFVFEYVKIAQKSSDQQTRDRSNAAKVIATIYWGLFVIGLFIGLIFALYQWFFNT